MKVADSDPTTSSAIERWLAEIAGTSIVLTSNPNFGTAARCGTAVGGLFTETLWANVRNEVSSWPDYCVSPLVDLSGLSRRSNVGRIWVKDEGERFGIGSFKALGGAYAVRRLIAAALDIDPSHLRPGSDRLPERDRERIRAMTVTCATDGNHGRAVAWGAMTVGCRCVIYIHQGVSAGRVRALHALGAQVKRCSGNYDDSVREAAQASRDHGWITVADTSLDESDASPRHVMAGYTLLMAEIAQQLTHEQPPTHVFVQAGVGALAAAVAAGACRYWAASPPQLVTVEPIVADCVRRSIGAGRPVNVTGSLDTIMAGLACGEVSHWAWPVLRSAVRCAIAIPDSSIPPAMRLAYCGVGGDRSLTLGESGVVGLAALLAARAQPAIARELDLDASSRVLLIGTEGITDPEIYGSLVPESYAADALVVRSPGQTD